jgi:hypothetical protein
MGKKENIFGLGSGKKSRKLLMMTTTDCSTFYLFYELKTPSRGGESLGVEVDTFLGKKQ